MTYGSTGELVSVNGTTMFETEKAILADFGLEENIWIPKSQMEDWPEPLENGEFLMPRWLAKEKGVI
jgi:hypothetical protein